MIKEKKTSKSRQDLLDLVSRYQQIIEISPHGIQENDVNGVITLSNPAHARMLGYEVEDLVGTYIWDVLETEEERNNFKNYFNYLLEVQPPPTPFTSTNQTKNGSTINVRVDWDYKLDDHGNIAGFISVVTDETELVEQEETLVKNAQRFRDFSNTAADRFWETGADHKVTYVSEARKNVIRPTEKILGKLVWEIGADEMNQPSANLLKNRMERHEPVTDVRYHVVSGGGKRIHLKISAIPVFGKAGNFAGYRGTIVDETAEVEAKNRDTDTQNLMSQCFEELPEGIIVWDKNDRLVTWNDRYRVLHSDVAHVLNKDMTYKEYIRKVGEIRSEALEEEGLPLEEWVNAQCREHLNLNSETIVHRNNGWILIRKFMLSDGCRVAYHTDVTDRKLANDAVRRLGHALEQSPSLVVITDTNGIIEYVNRKFTELTGYKPAEAIGKKTNMLQSGITGKATYEDLWQTIKSGREWHGEFHDKRKDGSSVWFSSSISPIKNEQGEITHFVSMGEDITERKRSELELMEAKDQAEIASSAKSEFLASMSHELRTPLNAIIGFSEMIKREDMGPINNEKYSEYIKHIHNSGDHLLSLINDILDTSVIEARKLKLHDSKVNLIDCVETAQNMVQSRANFGGVELRREIEPNLPLVLVDRLRMNQILLNLLTNAVKFTPVGGSVSTYLKRGDDGSVVAIIADTGVGMDQAGIARALEKFGQVDQVDPTLTKEGTGLGLPLTKGLVEAHGGSLEIESEAGGGTKVTITLPSHRVLESKNK